MKPLRAHFQKEVDESVEKYTASISFDRRLYRQDIAGSIVRASFADEGLASVQLQLKKLNAEY